MYENVITIKCLQLKLIKQNKRLLLFSNLSFAYFLLSYSKTFVELYLQ